MATLLVLRLELEKVPQPIQGYDSFIRLAEEEGLSVSTIKIAGGPGDPYDEASALAQVEGAHGYWILEPVLLSVRNIRNAVEDRLRDGALAFANLGSQWKEGREFFEELGLESTPIRAMPKNWEHSDKWGAISYALTTASRSAYPFGFRDPELFRDVEEIVLQQPNGLWCNEPILALPSAEIALLDTSTDLLVPDFSRPEFPVIATAAKREWLGRVIGTSAGLLRDPYLTMDGHQFPSIKAGDNLQMARNLIRMVMRGRSPPSYEWEDVYRLVSAIEIAMAKTTDLVLRDAMGDQWFGQAVPSETQKKCHERQAHEGAGFPIHAYLDLIDFKKIWKRNWHVFDQRLGLSARSVSRDGVLSDIQKTNDFRKAPMHPSKRHFAALPTPGREVFFALIEIRRRMDELSFGAAGAGASRRA